MSYTAGCVNCNGLNIVADTADVRASREHPDNGGNPCVDIPLKCSDCEWTWDLVIVSPPGGPLTFIDVQY